MNHIKYLLDNSVLEQWGFYFPEENILATRKSIYLMKI